jgi:hypothetical protein
MFQAEFPPYWDDKDKKVHPVSAKTATEFLKLMPSGFLLKHARKCKIDNICMKPAEFVQRVKEGYYGERITFRKILNIPQICDYYGIINRGTYLQVTTPPNQEQYEKTFERLGNHEIGIKYHGTCLRNLTSIVDQGLRASKHGALGKGIYVGNKDKARDFAGIRSYESIGILLEVECLFGEIVDITRDVKDNGVVLRKMSHDALGADTIYYGDFKRPEWCLKSPYQVSIRKFYLSNSLENKF